MKFPTVFQEVSRPDMRFFPFLVSDEAIYHHPPALLFGTVDKFAQLAHKIDNTEGGRKKIQDVYSEEEIGKITSQIKDIYHLI